MFISWLKWFFSPNVGGHQQPVKVSRELTILKGHQQNCQVSMFFWIVLAFTNITCGSNHDCGFGSPVIGCSLQFVDDLFFWCGNTTTQNQTHHHLLNEARVMEAYMRTEDLDFFCDGSNGLQNSSPQKTFFERRWLPAALHDLWILITLITMVILSPL